MIIGRAYLFMSFMYVFSLQFINAQGVYQDKPDVVSYVKENLRGNFDSVVISYKTAYPKEISSEFINNSQYETEKDVLLLDKEIQTLNKFSCKPSSYCNQLSGLTDRDIFILYYKESTLRLSILISTITRDISLIDGDNVIMNRISLRFEKYLTSLLQRKNIWDKEQTFVPFD